MSKLRPDRSTPAFPTVTEDPGELVTTVRTIVDALNIRDRRTRDVPSSFVTVKDLIDVGLITYDGQNAQKVATTTTSTGGTLTDGDKGDITVASSGAVWTIDLATVTNAKLANMATATFKGRTTAGTGVPEDLTATQATALLNTFTSTLKGLVPGGSGGGTTAYLRADGTWAVPPGTGGVTFANPTATVGPTAVNGTAVTAMRSDAAPAINAAANYTMTGEWTWNYAGTGSALRVYANATNWQSTFGFAGTSELDINAVSFSGAPSIGLRVGGNRYFQITAGNVDIQLGATLTVASISVRDGAILTSGTVAAARLPTFGTAAAGIVGASGGGTTNFLRADGTWTAPPGGSGGTAGNPTASVGLTAVNGVATTYMRSDAAPALSVAITPTWTGQHIFNAAVGMGAATPTADLHLGAGTATANTAPLKFTSGTNLTTPEAGAVEYDGSLFYKTPIGTARALNHNSYFYRKNTITSINNVTGAQSWLGLTSGVTLAANTIYYFEGQFQLSTTTTSAHTEAHGFALTTATVTNIAYSIVRRQSQVTAQQIFANYFTATTATATTNAISTVQVCHYHIQGTISVGTGGQVNPQITFNTAGPGAGSSVALGAWILFTPIGVTGSDVSIGTWA